MRWQQGESGHPEGLAFARSLTSFKVTGRKKEKMSKVLVNRFDSNIFLDLIAILIIFKKYEARN